MGPAILALVATAAAAGAALPDLVKGCTISPIANGVRLICEQLVASVSDYADLGLAQARETQLAGLKVAIKAPATTSVVPFTAGPKSWEATRLEIAGRDGKVSFQGHLLGASIGKGSRLAFCGAPLAKPELVARCPDLLAALMEQGPGPLAPPAGAPAFLGQAIPVPPGCRTLSANESHFRIQCGEAAYLAYLRVKSADELPKMEAMIREQLIKALPGAGAGKDRPCKVAGVATQCRTIEMGDASAQFVVYTGTAIVHGAPVLIQCGQLAKQKGAHAVCAPLLAL